MAQNYVGRCEDAPCCGCCLAYGELDTQSLMTEDEWNEILESGEEFDCGDDDDYDCDPGEMDGDHESGLASAGFGTDEDYGDWGRDDMYEPDYGGE